MDQRGLHGDRRACREKCATAGQTPQQTYPELIPDVEKVEHDWYKRTGIYPIHGTIVVKDAVIKKHPWLPRSLMDAFTKAKQPYLSDLRAGKGDKPDDKKYRGILPLMNDPLPYGIAANKPSIDALITYAVQQELIPKRPALSDVFVEIDP